MDKSYAVKWLKKALDDLYELFRVDHDAVYRQSLYSLGRDPFGYSEKTADYPGYKYNSCELARILKIVVV
jgi:hypothetical protein